MGMELIDVQQSLSLMSPRDRIFAAARRLASQYPPDKITMSEVAREAGVSQPTVRRYLGSKRQLQQLLSKEPEESSQSLLDTRSRILVAAKQVFARQGYAGATLDMIAAEAGLTKGAVYWHFESKSDLFLALMEEQLQSPLNITPEAAQQTFEHPTPQAEAEHLEFADNSIDAVVSTLVLCSVEDLEGTLQEILRVLKPGGRFYFLEHVAAPQGTWLRRMQQWIRPVWKKLGDGCRPDRETWVALEQAGFEQVEYQRFSAPVPAIVRPQIIGVAMKTKHC